MSDIIGYIVLSLAALIIVINIATTISPRFRRWVYTKEKN